MGLVWKNRSPQFFTERVEAIATFRRIRKSYMSCNCKNRGGGDVRLDKSLPQTEDVQGSPRKALWHKHKIHFSVSGHPPSFRLI